MRNLDACRNVPALADLIWSERALVERLHYKMVVAKLILAADERDLVSQSLAEIEDAVGALNAAEVAREQAIAAVARDWQVPAHDLTLAMLAEQAPDPWSSMFDEHRAAFQALTGRIERTISESQRLASTSLQAIQTSLGTLAAPSTGYDARGLASIGATAPTRVDRSL